MRQLLFAFAAIAHPAIAAERGYSVADFQSVRVLGAPEVRIVQARATTVRASGSTESLDRLKIEVRGGVLVIEPRAPASYDRGKTGPVLVRVTLPRLQSVRLAGSGTVSADRIAGTRVDASLAGSGSLSIAQAQADTLVVQQVGSGTFSIAGKAANARFSAQGSGQIDAATLTVADLVVDAASSGAHRFTARRSAKVTARGSGDVRVDGRPSCTVQSSGSGRVSCGE